MWMILLRVTTRWATGSILSLTNHFYKWLSGECGDQLVGILNSGFGRLWNTSKDDLLSILILGQYTLFIASLFPQLCEWKMTKCWGNLARMMGIILAYVESAFSSNYDTWEVLIKGGEDTWEEKVKVEWALPSYSPNVSPFSMHSSNTCPM